MDLCLIESPLSGPRGLRARPRQVASLWLYRTAAMRARPYRPAFGRAGCPARWTPPVPAETGADGPRRESAAPGRREPSLVACPCSDGGRDRERASARGRPTPPRLSPARGEPSFLSPVRVRYCPRFPLSNRRPLSGNPSLRSETRYRVPLQTLSEVGPPDVVVHHRPIGRVPVQRSGAPVPLVLVCHTVAKTTSSVG